MDRMPPGPMTAEVRSGSAVAMAALVVATYAMLCLYAYPANDDWFFASAGRDQGVLASLSSYWQGTGGRWAAVLPLYALGWSSHLPAIYPFLAALNLAALFAAGVLLAHLAGLRSWPRLLAAGLVLGAVQFTALTVLDIGTLGPHAAMPETVYWMSGAWAYAMAYPLLAAALWAMWAAARWPAVAVLAVVGLVVPGMSETAAVLAIVLGLAGAAAGNPRGWILAGAALAGFGLGAMAPGNLQRLALLRSEVDAQSGLAKLPGAMLACLGATATHLRDWLLNPAVLALLAVAGRLGAAAQPPPAGAERAWRRRAVAAAAAVPVGVWAASVPSVALVGFLEARQEGIVSLAAVAGLAITAFAAGRGWAGSWPSRWMPWVLAVALLAAAVARLVWRSPIAPMPWWVHALAATTLAAATFALLRRHPAGLMLVLAAALLWQPAWWQAVADATGKAPRLSRRQHARDQEVLRLAGLGYRHMALPWLGEAGDQPRTIRIYEIQPGWMADGYAGYFRLEKVVLATSLVHPMPMRPPAAKAAP